MLKYEVELMIVFIGVLEKNPSFFNLTPSVTTSHFSPILNILQDILRLILTIEIFDTKEMDGMKNLSNQIKPSTKKRLKFSRV